MTRKNDKKRYAFNTKDKHCYQIVSERVGTRNRATVKDIYGKKHRMSTTHFVDMSSFEAAVVSEGERIARRKHRANLVERQLCAVYRAFIAAV